MFAMKAWCRDTGVSTGHRCEYDIWECDSILGWRYIVQTELPGICAQLRAVMLEYSVLLAQYGRSVLHRLPRPFP